jgi:transposase
MKKHVGIDIAKRSFDLHILEDKKDMHCQYTPENVETCVEMLTKMPVELVVTEATGGYEIPLVIALQTAGIPVAVVNPRRIHDFAKAAGVGAKTDKIDAKTIARFAAVMQPPAHKKITANDQILRALVARRNQLIGIRTMEKNRKEHVADKIVARSIDTIIKTIEKEIAKVDKQITDRIEKQPELKEKAKLLTTVPGIADTTAAMLVVELPELGRVNKKEIAALMGVAPMNRDSGMFRGKRMTGGGRRTVRARLYMPTLAAIRHNPVIRKFYQHLCEQGKAKMTAVVAAMRKLLVILNTMVKKNQAWNPKMT